MSQLERIAEEKLQQMFSIIDETTVDGIRNDGLIIQSGDKIIKLKVVQEEKIDIAAVLEEKYRGKLRDRLQTIKEKLNEKISEMVQFTSRIKMEAETQERKLRDKIRNLKPMPEINFDHAKAGLSVVKGQHTNELHWLFRGIYWPKTVNGVAIEPRYSKKLLTNIIIMVTTKHDTVTGVSTRKNADLAHFSHYHQSNPDCWGKWRHASEWKTPQDIIRIAKEAEAVLENVNTHSIANNTPRGLPRLTTLKRHLVKATAKKDDKKLNMGTLNQAATRAGIRPDARTGDDDVWAL